MDENISSTLQSQIILNELRQKGETIYNYGLGENPLPQPPYYIEMMQKYSNKKHYSSSEGIDELKLFLHKKYNTSQCLVGNGLKELIYIIQLAFVGKIIHITPSWVSYKEQIKVLNREKDLIEIETTVENEYKINLDYLENILKHSNIPKLLFLNNPCNPTGVAYENDELEKIANIVKKYNCIVFADEIYLQLCYTQNIHSIARYIPNRTIRGSSVSKDLACGGYRLGWLSFPDELNDFFQKCNILSSNIYSCAPTPIQYATYHMLQNETLCESHFQKSRYIFSHITNEITSILRRSKLKFVQPMAVWYIFINFDNYKEQLRKLEIKDSISLNHHLLNNFKILTVAGEHFNVSGLNLRFSFVDFEFDMYNPTIKNINITHLLEGILTLVQFVTSL